MSRKLELQQKQDDRTITIDELLELRDIIRNQMASRGLNLSKIKQ